MFRSSKRHGADSADLDDMSLDFGRAFPPQFQPSDHTQDSDRLWAPGKEKDDAGTIRSVKVQTPTECAAEELNRIYANLPANVHDLTFQDLVEHGYTPKPGTEKEDKAKKGESAEKSRAKKKKEDRNLKVVKETGPGKTATKQHGTPKGVLKKKETVKGSGNDSPSSVPSKFTGVLFATKRSPPRSYPPTKSRLPTADHVDKLLEKKAKQSPKREGLYSASTTPTASFRRVSPDSPTLSGRLSERTSFSEYMLPPRTSFSDYMLPIDNISFERELTKSFGSIAENAGAADNSLSTQDRLMHTRSRNSKTFSRSRNSEIPIALPEKSDCSTCSLKNLIFETRCTNCGTSYCSRCAQFTTEDTLDGPKCLTDCKPSAGSCNKTRKGSTRGFCWSILVCHCSNAGSH